MKNLRNEEINTWRSNDKKVLWRLQKDIFSSPMKPVTVGYVEKSTNKALEFISRIAGVPTTLLKLSPVALKDFDVVSTLLEINQSASWRTKRRTSEVFDYLSKEERELGIEYAKAVLKAVRDDFREDSDGETLLTLRNTVENFQQWLEWLTDAAARIKLGITRNAA